MGKQLPIVKHCSLSYYNSYSSTIDKSLKYFLFVILSPTDHLLPLLVNRYTIESYFKIIGGLSWDLISGVAYHYTCRNCTAYTRSVQKVCNLSKKNIPHIYQGLDLNPLQSGSLALALT